MEIKIGAVLVIIFTFLLFGIFLKETQASNATIVYRDNATSIDTPIVREWNSTNGGSISSAITLANSSQPIRNFVIKYSPISSKRIIVTQNENGNLTAYVCSRFCNSSSSWVVSNITNTSLWTATPATNYRGFDVEFETASGDAIVVYAPTITDENKDLAYKILPAPTENNSFENIAENYINDPSIATDITYTWVELARNQIKTSTELGLIGFDSTGNDVNAWLWNKTNTTWDYNIELTAATTATSGRKTIDIIYPTNVTAGINSTYALAVSSDGTSGNVVGRYWSGSSWIVINPGDMASGNDDVQWSRLKNSYSNGNIMLLVQESGSDIQMATWNGANWTLSNVTDTTVDSLTTRVGDIVWNSSESDAFLM